MIGSSEKIPGKVTIEAKVGKVKITPNGSFQRARDVSLNYGGVWQEIYDQVAQAKELQQKTDETLREVTMERDLLKHENEKLQQKFKSSLSSLTETESHHLEDKVILEQIKSERGALQTRILAFEAHQEWLERHSKSLQIMLDSRDKKNKQLQQEYQLMDQKYQEILLVLRGQEQELKTRDEGLAQAQAEKQLLQQDITRLQKALQSKNNLYQNVIKERNQLQGEVQKMKDQKRNGRLTSSSNNHDDTIVLQPPLIPTEVRPMVIRHSPPSSSSSSSSAAILITPTKKKTITAKNNDNDNKGKDEQQIVQQTTPQSQVGGGVDDEEDLLQFSCAVDDASPEGIADLATFLSPPVPHSIATAASTTHITPIDLLLDGPAKPNPWAVTTAAGATSVDSHSRVARTSSGTSITARLIHPHRFALVDISFEQQQQEMRIRNN